MKKIDKSSRIPLYIQLMDILLDEIENELNENDQLMSEREICQKYDVSRTTVRQAVTELEREGYIYKAHGKGTFVAPKKMHQDLIRFYSFTEEMKKLGKTPSSRVLSFDIVAAGQKIGRKLGISENEKVYKFSRLRLADGVPMMLETTYVPYEIFPDMTREDLETTALYELFTTRFQSKISMAEEFFQPLVTRAHEAELLDMPVSVPSLKIERFTYENDRIIEYTNTIARGDKFKYRVRLEN
ncbi:GntR family transcriptional regulator [Paenactinomyces guangxiensis]|uniref:GntR family transcriptional regulator n=1 Tax=Paenactinomyces guangxiensis TaxID=1490290 RepID=A0A7W1WQF0_9BACL|nr:GntR family transcriptional regulator [Paenactinomyces guangxiensis]MBA4494169.1 GntR family transcriptional regulator [Paenactinomyces guangxiensis]MBH8591086.1 GntR family transcriptional regulator [Paenactinomyces guangxiensis]